MSRMVRKKAARSSGGMPSHASASTSAQPCRTRAACARPVYCYVKRPGSLVAPPAPPARTGVMKRTGVAGDKQLYQARDR